MDVSSLTPQQLAEYDFPNAKERVKCEGEDEVEIQKLFYQFGIDYRTFFALRERNNQQNLQYELNKKELSDIRKNISVLAIVGSSFNIPSEPLYHGKYQKDAEDLSTALFIRHLFHHVFGIPYNQILITSTENNDFINLDKNVDLISDTSNFYYKNPDKSPTSDYYFFLHEEEEFKLFQDINLTQVGTNQFKFLLSKSIRDIVKPFNISIIHDKCPNFTNDDSNLFVFFLDHGYPDEFSRKQYQFFIERLLEIKCKRFYVCNDSDYSGSMIKLIDICHRFDNIFPISQHIEVDSILFNILTNLNKVEDKYMQQEIEDKLIHYDFSDISQTSRDEVIQKLTQLDDQKINEISQFVEDLEEEFSNTKCIPKHFMEFAQKATIFTSSSFDQPSISLPGREFIISIKQKPRTRVFGNIFSSIFIESLLNKDAQKSLQNFHKSICYLFGEYKKIFKEYINNQNVPNVTNKNNDSLLTTNEVEVFFDYRIEDKSRYYKEQDDWPDLSSIMLDKKLWNVDISEVNEEEYKNVRFSIFKIAPIRSQVSNSANFGPVRNMNFCEKFKKDFEKAVNSLLARFSPVEEFSAFDSIITKEISKKKCIGYAQFIGGIRPIKPNFSRVIMSLKIPIANFFFANNCNIDRDAKCFIQAFKTISPFWDKYDI